MNGELDVTPAQIAAHDDQRDLGAAGAEALVKAYQQVFPSDGWLLDAGGGSGTAVPALASTGAQVLVVDWSLNMLGAALRGAGKCCAGDLRALPLQDAAFRGVHAAFAIQNVAQWKLAVQECVRVAEPSAPIMVAWGGPPADGRLAGIEGAYFAALGAAAGLQAQRSGLTVQAADEHFQALGRPLQGVLVVEGEQQRTPRQIIERASLNPYRAQAAPLARDQAARSALDWAQKHVALPDEPVALRVVRRLHVYRA